MASNYDRRSSSSVSRGSRRGSQDEVEPVDRRRSVRARHDPRKESYYRRMRVLAVSVVSLMLVLIAYVVVVYSPLFETISSLAAVPGGSTLFNVDEKGVAERLAANPWIASATLSRSLPDRLLIEVVEREACAVVMLSNGSEAWLLAEDGYWLEPVPLQEATADGSIGAPADQARAAAAEQGLVYIGDVSALVRPQAGAQCTDGAVLGVTAYLEGFTEALRDQIVSAKAASRESIAVILSNGVEVSLGAPTDIEAKEKVVLALLSQYPGQITYINARIPTAPSWRGLGADVTGDPQTVEGADPVPVVSSAPSTGDGDAGEGAPEDAPSTQEAVGQPEGGPGGNMDEGGYYGDSGHWVYAYHDANGTWINGFYDDDGAWVALS